MYQALYRKYRPKSFEDVVGQEVIVKTLKNAIVYNQVSHAYMLVGPRGTGKTTIAKLLSRTVNCENPIDGNACEKCFKCNVSRETECIDIIEIDAASNNGVDEIRELRNKVNLVPAELKYKVYIIDEVHMLTTGAFNALLKTLEEPPKHIIFILATTDPQKVPETIISRCQCFSFKRISNEMISKRLKEICEKEKIEIDEEVLNEIAIISDGGMRDSLGMLDKLRAFTDNKITINDFVEVNGIISSKNLQDLTNMIINKEILNTVNYLDELNQNGKNIIQIMIQLLNYLRNTLIDSFSNNIKIETEQYINLANLLNEKMFDIKKTENPKIYIEILLIGYMTKEKIISREIIFDKESEKQEVKSKKILIDEPSAKIEVSNEVEKNDEELEKINLKSNKSIPKNIDEVMKIRINNTFAEASKDELEYTKRQFEKLNEYTFDQKIGYLVCELLDGKIRASSKTHLILSYEYDSMVNKNMENIEKLAEVLSNILHLNKKISIISDEVWQKEKQDFILNKRNGQDYILQEEPPFVYEEEIKIEENSKFDEAFSLFGDIIEVD